MRSIVPVLLLLVIVLLSCSSVKHIFTNSTPHEKYAEKIEDKLQQTPEGRLWLAMSARALLDAQTVQLPYYQFGSFRYDRPQALALQFNALFGQRIVFDLTPKTAAQPAIFADLYRQDEKANHLLAADTSSHRFSIDIDKTGSYVLRLQPQLNQGGEYTLSVSVGPSLGFPVSGTKANIGSLWGDDRDGGKRAHEGIDIFAPKLTPAIAAADGVVTGVREGGLGGKTVWVRMNEKSTYLYYAHLDKQLVQEGQQVKKGDTVGLVGNTGNARTTPSHLHFGVYTADGPVNPLPFVDRSIRTAPAVAAKNLARAVKLIKSQRTNAGVVVSANTELFPLAVNAKGYLAELPDGNVMQTPFALVKVVSQAAKAVPLTRL